VFTLQHLACCTVNTGRCRLRIAISAYPTCIRRLRYGGFLSEYCYAIWQGKTRMMWLPDGEKNFDAIFIRFDTIHERDRHTHTTWQHRPRSCIALRSKKIMITYSRLLYWVSLRLCLASLHDRPKLWSTISDTGSQAHRWQLTGQINTVN